MSSVVDYTVGSHLPVLLRFTANGTIVSDLLVVLASHNELTRRSEAILRRCLDSLSRAMKMMARQRRHVDVYVACCDDASDDGAAEVIERYFAGKTWFKLVRNRTRHYIGFSRNVAAAQFPTELICFLDTDDAYRENHLVVCADIMAQARDSQGRQVAVASTAAALNVAVHPEWLPHISATIPLTKVVRRAAWEFVEGMPAESLYFWTSCEDQFFMEKLQTFFMAAASSEETAMHYSHPGSSLDKQLAKFQKAPDLFDPATDTPAEVRPLHALRLEHEAAVLRYLKSKWSLWGWQDRLQGLATRSP